MTHAFDILKGWTTKFEIDGVNYGGTMDLCNDWRLQWHLEQIDVKDKTVLELGPLEGAHTLMLEKAGAWRVIAIEGNVNNFLKCVVIKNELDLDASFIFGDFCQLINDWAYTGVRFDLVSAAGVLYHQQNPAELIYDLARITDTVLVWSQVANDTQPAGAKSVCSYNGKDYGCKVNDYGDAATTDVYCGGLNGHALWMYPDEMLRCFNDAGFKNIIQKDCPATVHGDSLLFVAKK